MSRREREIVRLAVEGNTSKEIAEEMELSVGDVNTRMRGVARKLHLISRHEVIIWVLQHPHLLKRDVSCEVGLHPFGCPCEAPYCLAMRIIAA